MPSIDPLGSIYLSERKRLSENLITKAAHLAYKAHQLKKRKYSGDPYIEHPMRVAGRISQIAGVPDYAVAAAWLHDVKEDCREFWDENHSKLPQEVIELVDWLTNTPKSGEYAQLNRAARKAIDREKLSKAPYWAKIIKAYDRMDNLSEISTEDIGFARLYCEESEALLFALASNKPGDDVVATCIVAAGYIRKLREKLPESHNGEKNGNNTND